MIITATNQLKEMNGGVNISTPTGILILIVEIVFTVDVPLLMIWKGRND
tara:strand:- start:1124 stop:1270 length:147 start_codon:yes stop_codon:yes gene_type:complete